MRLEPGCDKRAETCREKFDNFLNFRGFPHIPGEDWLISYPVSSGVERRRVARVRRADPTQVVAVARSWIGTPYRASGLESGGGRGLPGPSARASGAKSSGRSRRRCPAYTPDWAEPRGREVLLDAGRTWLLPHEGELARGDVLLFRMRDGGIAKHLGICSDTGERGQLHPRLYRAMAWSKARSPPHGCAGSRRVFVFPAGDR